MSPAFDDAAHFWEDKLQKPWQSGAEKMQQLTTSPHQNNQLFLWAIISLVILGCLRFFVNKWFVRNLQIVITYLARNIKVSQ